MVSATLLYPRRAFLSWCLGVLATGHRLPSMGRRLRSKGHRLPAVGGAQTYRDLETPVVLPAEAITGPWSSLPFEARVPRDDPTVGAAVLDGVLLRTGAKGAPGDRSGSDEAGGLQAFCLLCPHEICHVEYRSDPSQVRLEIGETPQHPLLVCPCHFSVFNPLSGGALISGPAYRGLYRFKAQVEQDSVKITQVEEEVLTLFDAVSLQEEALTLLDTVSPEKEALTLLDVVSPSREER